MRRDRVPTPYRVSVERIPAIRCCQSLYIRFDVFHLLVNSIHQPCLGASAGTGSLPKNDSSQNGDSVECRALTVSATDFQSSSLLPLRSNPTLI